MNNRGQITVFIIIAIFIVVAGGIFFVFKDSIITEKIPSEFRPMEASFLSCIEEHTLTGISVLQSRGGNMNPLEFVPGSRYMPFSSEMDFFGLEVPYWHYISGNNIDKEQVPSIEYMEEQLSSYLEEKIFTCSFESYREQGYSFNLEEPSVEVSIKDEIVSVDVDAVFFIYGEEENHLINKHSVEVNSKLGSLYKKAKEVYETEEQTFFLENYSIDVLRNYLPVDGVEISCSPLSWNVYDLYEEFFYALEANIYAIKNEGANSDYFALNLPVDADLKFIFFRDWPNTFEVDPADSATLVAEPIGTQAGLGVLGFCYVPYHFVYNVRFPVMIQVSEGEETFQFPLVVLIEGNLPREARTGDVSINEIPNLCDEENNTLTKINLYNSDLEEIEGRVKFECFSSTCELGHSEGGVIEGNLPQCVNGKLIVEAEGYKTTSLQYTSVNEGELSIMLDKLYEKKIDLIVDGLSYTGNAIISFSSEEGSFSLVYPSQKSISLGEGTYEIRVQLYEDSKIEIPASTREECYEVPRSGVGGMLGLSTRECQEVEMPSQIISNALIGGGNDNYYFLDNELNNGGTLELKVRKLKTPTTLEEVQENYILFETFGVEVGFK